MRARWRSCGVGGRGIGIGIASGGGVTAGTGVTLAAGARGSSCLFVPLVPSAVALTHSCRSFYKTHLHQPPQQLSRVRISRYHTIRATHSALLRAPDYTIFNQRRSSSTSNMSELKWPSKRVRQAFFDYMEQRGHTIGMQNCPSLLNPEIAAIARTRHTAKGITRRMNDDIWMLQSSRMLYFKPLSLPEAHANTMQFPLAQSFPTMTPPCSSPMLA